MFMNVAGDWPDWVIGLILLILALSTLIVSLVLMVKILSNIFKGKMALVLKKFVNADFPGKYWVQYVCYSDKKLRDNF